MLVSYILYVIMLDELKLTLVVFRDLFTKWLMVYPTSDQKAKRIARLLVNEIVSLFGVPEALLSDRGQIYYPIL